jgi:hypothetical protein
MTQQILAQQILAQQILAQQIQQAIDLLPDTPKGNQLREDYIFELIPLHCGYSTLTFDEILKHNNFIQRINRLLPPSKQISDTPVKKIYPIGCCGELMITNPDKAISECHTCGRTEQLRGCILTNGQFYSNKGVNPSIYRHTTHCKKILRCLQGLQSTVIPNKLITRIKLEHKRLYLCGEKYISVAHVRRILKLLKMSKHNINAVKIKYMVTGNKSAPTLSHNESKHIIFQLKTFAEKSIKLGIGSLSHIFLIRKLIEQHLPEGERKEQLLHNLPVQSRESYNKNQEKFNTHY